MSRRLTVLLIAILALKALLLLADSAPSFQFGDSGSYLATAITKWIPPDRSFVYGFLLRPIVLTTHSLFPVVLLQSFLSGIAAWLVAVCLLRYFQSSFAVAAFASLACAVEPLQLMFERFIMTEAAATFGFAVFFLTALEFLRTGKAWLLVVIGLLGTFLVSVRFSFLPLVLVLSLVIPLLSPARQARRLLVLAAISVLTSQALLYGYRHLYGRLVHEPPAYLSRDGEFLLADISPLVIPADFPIAQKRSDLFAHLKIWPATPESRLATRWLPGGLCDAMLQAAGNNEYQANRLARKTAVAAIKRNPLGVLNLGWYTYRDFFHRAKIDSVLLINQGQFVEAPPSHVEMIQQAAGIDVRHRRYDSLTKRWQAISAPWCWLVILLPPALTLDLLLRRTRWTRANLLCLLCSWIFLAGAVIPTELANPRYLLPLTWLTCLTLGALLASLKPNSPTGDIAGQTSTTPATSTMRRIPPDENLPNKPPISR